MDLAQLLGVVGLGLLGLMALVAFAPAQVAASVDTRAGDAHARLRLLWGLGPSLSAPSGKRSPRSGFTAVARGLHAAPRVVSALALAPQILPVVRQLLVRIRRLKPRVADVALSLNAADPRVNAVIGLVEAALADVPGVAVTRRASVGLDVQATFLLDASPLTLLCLYASWAGAPPVRAFLRRLRPGPTSER